MKAKSTVFLTVGIILTALLLVTVVSARMMPRLAHAEFFDEMSAAEVESASALFAEDAVINNNLTGDSYAGQAAISPLLESWVNDSRSYEVVAESSDGDTTSMHTLHLILPTLARSTVQKRKTPPRCFSAFGACFSLT